MSTIKSKSASHSGAKAKKSTLKATAATKPTKLATASKPAKPAILSKSTRAAISSAAGSSTKPTRPTKPPSSTKLPVSPKSSKALKAAKPTKATKLSASPKGTVTSAPKSKKPAKLVKDTERGASSDVFKKVSAQIANEEMTLLCQHYPEADCELDFETPFQLITSVIMSAQTTDVNVNKVTPNLFRKYPDAQSLAEAPLDDIKEIIKSTGFFNAKATNIQNCAKRLVEKFGGEVPRTIEELVTLPGVGRKTANVVLGVCFGVPGWTVDTHVQRLSKRLGFTNEQDPEKIEYALQDIFPGRDWSNLSITLIWHGRRICFARKPNCESCPINHLCPSSLAP
jgi:endonuclease-3